MDVHERAVIYETLEVIANAKSKLEVAERELRIMLEKDAVPVEKLQGDARG